MSIRIMLFACGIALALRLPDFTVIPILVFFIAVAFIAFLFKTTRPLYFLAGFMYCIFYAALIMQTTLPEELEGEIIHIEAQVIDLPTTDANKTRFILRPIKVINNDLTINKLPKKIQTSWYQTKHSIKPGQVWRLGLKLKTPHGLHNPNGFDYEFWLFQQGIGATAYIHKKHKPILISDNHGISIDRYRYELSNWLSAKDNLKYNSVYQALIVGDRSNISEEQWHVFRQTGTSHLIAISGLHITLVSGLFFFLSRFIWSRNVRLNSIVATPQAAAYISMIVAVLYAAMAGFSLPTLRALIMLTVFMLGQLYARRFSIVTVLLTSTFFILLLDPFSLLKADYWLSFTAVALIAYLVAGRKQQNKYYLAIRIQLFLSLALIPLTLYYFNIATLNGIAANIIAVPFTSFLLLPLLFLSLFLFFFSSIQNNLLNLIDYTFDYFWSFLNFLLSIDYSFININVMNTATALIFMLIACLILFSPKGLVNKSIGLLCFMPLFFYSTNKLKNHELELTLLDVGQGLAVLIQSKNQTVLFDTGANYSEKFNIGTHIIVPFLQRKNINSLDKIIISHGDNDHIGGLAGVLSKIKVDEVISSVANQQNYAQHTFCQQGLSWQADNIIYEFLHPDAHSNTQLSNNDSSCVLMIKTEKHNILLTGDIESRAEQILLGKYAQKLKADVMLIPHHGSRTSSSIEFIQQVQPDIALVSSGYKNRFGFPKDDVIQRYLERDIQVFNTAIDGAITLKFTPETIDISIHREQYRRFWHHQARQED